MNTLQERLKYCQNHTHFMLERMLGSTKPCSTHDAMRYACLNGGKRIRPYLALCVAELFEHDWQAVAPLAVAVEAIHCYSLVHDDLPAMDNDDLRRGLPTCHKRFDEATAILAGDAIVTLAFEWLSQPDLFSDKRVQLQIINLLAQKAGFLGMIKGQTLDLSAEGKTLTLAQLIEMHSAKTGALIEAVVQCTGLICGASPDDLEQLQVFAQKCGLAFQIQDDLLDSLGCTKTLGKTTQQDMKQHKSTFVSVLGINAAKDFAKKTIKDAKEALTAYGVRAQHCNELADYIIERIS